AKAPHEETVDALLLAVEILEETLRIEHFVPLVDPAAAMKFRGSTLGHYANDSVGVAAVLRLVVAGEHELLSDGIDVGLVVRSAVRPGIQVGDSIHCKICAGIYSAVDTNGSNAVFAGSITLCDIDSGQRHQHAKHVAAFESDVR